jgi:hypothetical protein
VHIIGGLKTRSIPGCSRVLTARAVCGTINGRNARQCELHIIAVLIESLRLGASFEDPTMIDGDIGSSATTE